MDLTEKEILDECVNQLELATIKCEEANQLMIEYLNSNFIKKMFFGNKFYKYLIKKI